MNVTTCILFFTSLFICQSSKRSLDDDFKGGGAISRKKFRTLTSSLSEIVRDGKVEEFTALLRDNQIDLSLAADQRIDSMLFTALDSGNARLFQRMMTVRRFRDRVTYEVLSEVILNCRPDILYAICGAKLDPKEPSPFSSEPTQIQALFRSSSYTCPAKVKLLLPHVIPRFTETIIGWRMNTTLRQVLERFFYFENKNMLPLDRDILWLTAIHLHESFLIPIYFSYLASPMPAREGRPAIMLLVEEIVLTLQRGDLEALRSIFERSDEDMCHDLAASIAIAAEYAASIGFFDAFKVLFEFSEPSKLSVYYYSYTRDANILRAALLANQLPKVVSAFNRKALTVAESSYGATLLQILDDMVYEADFDSILLAARNWPKEVSPMSAEQMVYVRLAEAVMNGDWRHILIFAELHPDRIMAADYAWEIFWNRRPADKFCQLAEMIASSKNSIL